MRQFNVTMAVSSQEKPFTAEVTFFASNLRELDDKLRVYADSNHLRFDLVSISVLPDFDYQPLPF